MSKRKYPRHSENCPVKKDTEEIVGLGVDMVKALRRLRRDLQACERCGRLNCGILETFHTQVDIAIQELNEEWGVQPFRG
jgi:hypothetical protein